MSIPQPMYEVKVKIPQRGLRYVIRTYLIEAKDSNRARERCRKHGIPLSAHKMELTNSIEHLQLIQPPLIKPSPAIAMDEFIWQKRNIRRNNMYKDKENQ